MTDEPTTPPTIEAHLASIATSMSTIAAENTDLRVRLDAALLRIDDQNDLIRRRTRAYKVTVAAFIAVLVAFGVILLDNQRSIRENNRLWCPTLGAIIQPASPPPATSRGQTTVDLLTDLFVQYGCTPADLPQ